MRISSETEEISRMITEQLRGLTGVRGNSKDPKGRKTAVIEGERSRAQEKKLEDHSGGIKILKRA